MSFYFGVDYYPEHWPQDRWETDAVLMEQLGIQVVRMGEFSWTKMEPKEGEFHFEWLDQAINTLAAHGIQTVLGTPTAAPPAWMVRQDPDILPVDSHGLRREFGGRHHDCQSNHHYRQHIRRLVTAMAARFGHHPHVVGWQVDNELGNSHGDFCYCPHCEAAFRRWLQQKYGSIEELNRAWGTAFWSQEYSDFHQIISPKVTPNGHNPSQMLDWKRFCSDLVADFMRFQVHILRQYCDPRQFITHNCMGFADKVSYFELGKDLDFLSHDQYPGGYFAQPPHQPNQRLAAELDFIRGCKGKNFWIMEQQAGITGWECMGRNPAPGQLGLWTAQSVAHGADTVVYFRWRSCLFGTEQYWHGILPHSGKPGRTYQELKEVIAALRPYMEETQGITTPAQVGIVYSYDQNYAMQIQPHNPKLTYLGQVMKYYTALYQANVPVDFLSDQGDFSKYKLLIAPLQYLTNPELEQKYRDYVAQGGHLVLTMRTGVKDDTNLCHPHTLPGGLSDVLGIEVPEYDCLWETSLPVQWDGELFSGEQWCDLLAPSTAKTLAVAAGEWYAGTPVITCNRFGQGQAWYVGSEPDEELMNKLMSELLRAADVSSLGEAPEGVELACRKGRERNYLFVLNHTETPQTVALGREWESREVSLPPYGFAVVGSAGEELE